MKRRTKGFVIVAIAACLVVFFFCAPVFFYTSVQNSFVGSPSWSMYRSAGCMFFGVGDTYETNNVGFIWGCPSPPILF